jgi:hypothetical protein
MPANQGAAIVVFFGSGEPFENFFQILCSQPADPGL